MGVRREREKYHFTRNALCQVREARWRQVEKGKRLPQTPSEWLVMIGREYGEMCRCIAGRNTNLLINDAERNRLLEEIIQSAKELAATAAAVIERSMEIMNEGEDTPIDIYDLDFGYRIQNCLQEAGIETLDELIDKTAEELMTIPRFGKKCLYEVREKLRIYDLYLKGEVVDEDG